MENTIRRKLKKFLDSNITKLVFAISIIASAIPSIYQDLTYGHQGTWTHYGMVLVGILYFIETSLWTLDVIKEWKEKN
jgi:hypothetical protein